MGKSILIRRVIRFGGLLVLLMGLSACVPIPNMEYHAPPIRGEMTRDGAPLADAKLILTAGFNDVKTETVYSDKDGKFELPAIKEFHFTAFLLGDTFYRYKLNVEYDGISYLGFEQSNGGDPRELVVLSCDLAKPTSWMRDTVYCKAN